MFCHLQYSIDKEYHRKYFFDNYNRTHHHKTEGSELFFWRKLFNIPEIADPIINDLGLNGLDIWPRFSYQFKNTRLPEHIDIQRAVAVNINLMEFPATIHLNDLPYEYEVALIDVGSIRHSVEPVNYDRLILKLAIFNPWDVIYSRLKDNFIIDSSCEDYKSILKEEDKKFVKI